MLSIQELTKRYRDGSLSPVDYAKQQLSELRAINTKLNATTQIFGEESILQSASESAKRYQAGRPLSVFDGILITIKDINAYKCKGIKLWNGSAIKEAVQIPDVTQPHLQLMLDAGAIMIAQTTSPEVGFKATTNSVRFGVTRNARNVSLTSGGSSGGAATLAAAGVANLNFGSDGGGSIRIPAACCGVIGLKPSFGIGYVNDFPFLSHVAPLVNHMDDLRLYMEFICSNAENAKLWKLRVPTPVLQRMDFSKQYICGSGFDVATKKRLKIGVSKTLNGVVPDRFVDARVWKKVLNAVQLLRNDGFSVEEAEPVFGDALRKRYFFILANMWRISLSHRYGPYVDERNQHLVDPVLRRIMEKGDDVTAHRLFQSLMDRDEVKKAVNEYFVHYDLLITPTLAILPPPAWSTEEESDKERMKIPSLLGMYTGMFNLTHNPAISVNCAVEKGNIPVGVQIVGDMYRDDLVMKFAETVQCLCGKLKIAKL